MSHDVRSEPDEPPGSEVVELAAYWLGAHYEQVMLEALDELFLSGLSVDQQLRLGRLPQPLMELMHLNGREHLLAEGMLFLEAGPIPCLELVLGPGGPELSQVQRRYLEALGRQPMSIYRVVAAKPGEGLRLRDLLDDHQPERWVAEPLISHSLACHQGTTFSSRLIPGDPWRLARSFYPTQEPHLSSLLEQIGATRDAGGVPESMLRSQLIIYSWLVSLANTQPLYFAEALRDEVH